MSQIIQFYSYETYRFGKLIKAKIRLETVTGRKKECTMMLKPVSGFLSGGDMLQSHARDKRWLHNIVNVLSC